MGHVPRRTNLRPTRRDLRLVVAASAVTAIACGSLWTFTSAAAAPGVTALAATTTSPTYSTYPTYPTGDAPPTSSTWTPPASTATSRTWTFEDGTTGGWYGFGYGASTGPGAQRAAWVAPSPDAAYAGRSGLLVGDLPHWAFEVGVDLTSDLLAPGTYAVTARARLAPGQPRTLLRVDDGATEGGTPVTDAAWSTVTGTVEVPAGGRLGRLLIGPGYPPCDYELTSVSAPATHFYLDQVALRRVTPPSPSSTPTTPTPTTPTCTTPPPRATPAAMLHYEVTSVGRGGFTATLTIHNVQDQDHPIVGWSVPLTLGGRRVLWVAGARLVTVDGVPKLTGTPVSPTAVVYGNSTYRLSLGLSGDPVGSHDVIGPVEQAVTGWE